MFKKILFSKKYKTAVLESKPLEWNVTIPRASVKFENTKDVYNPELHDTFSEIIDTDDGLVRIESSQSTEIVRVLELCSSFQFKHLDKNYEKRNLTDPVYIERVTNHYFVTRYFKTNNGKYFFQIIRPNGEVNYAVVSLKYIQECMTKWEVKDDYDENSIYVPYNNVKVFNNDRYVQLCILPGRYSQTNSMFNIVGVCDLYNRYIDYTVINNDLYTKLIPTL